MLLLLHGVCATAGLNWFGAFPPLQDRYRLVALDQRGHGRGIHVSRDFSLEDCADDVVALADVLGIDRFVAVGYSMGGPVAQLVWRRHRARVAGLVLCATARNFRGTRSATLLTEALPGMWVAAQVGPDRIARSAGSLLARILPSELARATWFARNRVESPVVAWAVRELSRSSPMGLVQALRELSRFSSHAWIGEVDVPTAVVVTMRDRMVRPERQLKLARAIANATVLPVQGDHFVPSTSPSLFIPALVEAVDLVTQAHGRS